VVFPTPRMAPHKKRPRSKVTEPRERTTSGHPPRRTIWRAFSNG